MSPLLSCSNCWYNALQAGSLGTSFGYCAEYRVILRRPDETTCKRQLRKDLLLDSALREHQTHNEKFGPEDGLKLVQDGESAANEIYQTKEIGLINGDRVANLVTEYGEYGSKIESLAQLRSTEGSRAELALLSLARGYTNRCMSRDGNWKSGIHLLWWTRQKLQKEPIPHLDLDDFRYQLPIPIKRQIELGQWFILMLRLVFISDIAKHATESGDDIHSLADFAEDAALSSDVVDVGKLASWVKKVGIKRFDKVLPYNRYTEYCQIIRDN